MAWQETLAWVLCLVALGMSAYALAVAIIGRDE